MLKIIKDYHIAPGEKITLPPEGMMFITGVEVKCEPTYKLLDVGKNRPTFPQFSVSDDSGVINGLSTSKFELKGASIMKLEIGNPNKDSIHVFVTVEQSHE